MSLSVKCFKESFHNNYNAFKSWGSNLNFSVIDGELIVEIFSMYWCKIFEHFQTVTHSNKNSRICVLVFLGLINKTTMCPIITEWYDHLTDLLLLSFPPTWEDSFSWKLLFSLVNFSRRKFVGKPFTGFYLIAKKNFLTKHF